MDQFSDADLRLRSPFCMVLSGPSSSGKTRWLLRFIQNVDEMVDPGPKEILYCYGEYHQEVATIERMGVRVVSGIPSDELIDSCQKPMLLVLDDLMLAATETWLNDLFTKRSHHRSVSVVFVTQNLFEKSLKVARNNAQYYVLMRAPGAVLGIRTLGSQIFPKQLNFFMSAYTNATRDNYGYLFVDLHPASDPTLRLRTNIYPNETTAIFIA